MTKLTILQNTFRRNPYLRETVCLNLIALKQAKIDFQYIIFNDKGDPEIEDDIKEFSGDIEYFYSHINYGRRMGRGGWIGGLHLVKGKYIHVSDQDDVMTPLFYRKLVNELDENEDIYVVFSNGFVSNEKLQSIDILIDIKYYKDYTRPLDAFKFWFGIEPPVNKVTKANNGVLGPGTIYRTELHNLVGTPDPQYGGAYDFEYWSRILFNEYKMLYIREPLWFYRQSGFSAGDEIIDGKPNRGYWQQLYIEQIKEKYSKLWDERVNAETDSNS